MNCGRSSSVEWKLPKLQRRVRFPSPAPPPLGYAPGGFVMPPRQARLACRTHFGRPNRYKTLPARSPRGSNRYKTLPAHSPAGDTGTKLPQLAAQRATPVQNSPCTPKMAHFSTFYASRENFIPLAPPTNRAGRTLYRTRGRCRYKTLPARSPRGSNRYKTLPAPPKWPISARFTPAGRTLYRSHHQQVEQGEKSPAPTPHLTHQRAPPTISHAILLHEFSTKPRNVAIPTT